MCVCVCLFFYFTLNLFKFLIGAYIDLPNELLDTMVILLQMGQLLIHPPTCHLRQENYIRIRLILGQAPQTWQRALIVQQQARVKGWQLESLWV